MPFSCRTFLTRAMAAPLAALLLSHAPLLAAQAGAPSEAAKPAASAAPVAEAGPLAQLAWLNGCWTGTVNRREFREQWMPLRGDMMLGVGHTVTDGKTQDYEYIRLELRPDGVYYVGLPSGEKETAFKLSGSRAIDGDTEFTFTNTVDAFPQRIVYRRATQGWLYATVEGKLNGEDRKVIYPMRRIGCESGEFILK